MGTVPLEFACHVFERLHVFSLATLDTWHLLHKEKTGVLRRAGGVAAVAMMRSGAKVGKTFVKVFAEHDESGQVRPLFLTWTDGKRYEIDRVTDVRQSPSLRGGGLGVRYTV